MRRAWVFFQLGIIFSACAVLWACTPGAATNPNGGTGQISNAVIVHVSLLKYPPVSSQYGMLAGYSPNPLTVQHGAVVQFVNDDNFSHTASFVGTSGFVGGPLNSSALGAGGVDLATAGWSTGALQGGGFSQGLSASTAGTYYFQCFYHYTQMHGVIIVQ
jgi:plastocyanin